MGRYAEGEIGEILYVILDTYIFIEALFFISKRKRKNLGNEYQTFM